MNVRPEQLAQHLQGKLAPLYVVHGDEPLLALEAADWIRAAAKKAGYAEREIFTVEAGFSWENLLFSGNSFSLFGDQRLLDVRIPSGKPGIEGGKTIQQYCAALPQDSVTLITLPKLERQTQNSQWFKSLESAGVVVAVYPVERNRLPQWIQQRLADQGQQADKDTLEFLADSVEGNLIAAKQEIQKLSLLLPQGRLSFEDVKNAVLDVSRYDVFKLGDTMLIGDTVRFAKMVEGLRGEGEAPTLILWVLSNEIRALAKIKQGQRKGAALGQLMRSARIWEARQPLVEKALRRVAEPTLKLALQQAAALDKLIKGLRSGDVWDEILQLGLLLTTSTQKK